MFSGMGFQHMSDVLIADEVQRHKATAERLFDADRESERRK